MSLDIKTTKLLVIEKIYMLLIIKNRYKNTKDNASIPISFLKKIK